MCASVAGTCSLGALLILKWLWTQQQFVTGSKRTCCKTETRSSSDRSSEPSACSVQPPDHKRRRRQAAPQRGEDGGGAVDAAPSQCACKSALCITTSDTAALAVMTPNSRAEACPEFWKICYGSLYLMREKTGKECRVDFRADILSPLLGQSPSALGVTPHVPLAGSDCDFIKNVRVMIHFPTCNRLAVWPELHRKVATFRAQPWMANTLFSVFGNVYYRMDAKTLDCTALRDLKHAQVLAHIVRDEATHGRFESVEVLNFNLMRTLDRYVQVTVGGLLERVLVMCFRDIVQVVPRTEEMSGVLYLVLCNVSAFIRQGQYVTGKPVPAAEVERCLATACMAHCRANLHVTYSGKITINFAWRAEYPKCTPVDLTDLQRDIQTTAGYLCLLIRELC